MAFRRKLWYGVPPPNRQTVPYQIFMQRRPFKWGQEKRRSHRLPGDGGGEIANQQKYSEIRAKSAGTPAQPCPVTDHPSSGETEAYSVGAASLRQKSEPTDHAGP